jgi:hypothetical protein
MKILVQFFKLILILSLKFFNYIKLLMYLFLIILEFLNYSIIAIKVQVSTA